MALIDAQAASALTALRDIAGVLGSFLLDADGRILARDLPPLFDVVALTSASVHLSRLRAALEHEGSAFESCVARFGPHLLLLRAARENTLCVLCPRGTNMPAVHMSSTLIARRISQPIEHARASLPPGELQNVVERSSSPSMPPLAPAPASEPPVPSRLFRGRRV